MSAWFLAAPTPQAWLEAAAGQWPALLSDHANCEKKAASTALALMFAYPQDAGLCVALAPAYFGMDNSGKAFARTKLVEWSSADGDFVHQCPTLAIVATRIDTVSPEQPVQRTPTPPSVPKAMGAA